ncbi:hypothetical protein REPUB_Repub15cG0037900 [Reevesia pubescens]
MRFFNHHYSHALSEGGGSWSFCLTIPLFGIIAFSTAAGNIPFCKHKKDFHMLSSFEAIALDLPVLFFVEPGISLLRLKSRKFSLALYVHSEGTVFWQIHQSSSCNWAAWKKLLKLSNPAAPLLPLSEDQT